MKMLMQNQSGQQLNVKCQKKGDFDSLQDAKTELFDYIEAYYNRKRRHSSLGYQSPEKFEEIFNQNQFLNLQSKVSAV